MIHRWHKNLLRASDASKERKWHNVLRSSAMSACFCSPRLRRFNISARLPKLNGFSGKWRMPTAKAVKAGAK